FRPWLHYWAVPGKVRLSASPVGHWGTWSPVAEGSATVPVAYYSEYRSSWQLSLFQKIGKLDIQQRYRYEFRWLSTSNSSKVNVSDLFSDDYHSYLPSNYKTRLRYMAKASYPINRSGSSYLALWD